MGAHTHAPMHAHTHACSMHTRTHTQVYWPQDVVFEERTTGSKMFFIHTGVIELYSHACCEPLFLLGTKRTRTHARTHARMHARALTHACMHARIHALTTHAHTQMHTYS